MENTLFWIVLEFDHENRLVSFSEKPYLLPSEHNYMTAYAKDLGKRRTEAIIFI